MRSYANPLPISYSFGSLNFASGAGMHKVLPPPGCGEGRVEDIHVRVTTTFTAVTTPAYVHIGVAADAAKYAELALGTTAAGESLNLRSGVVKSNNHLTKDAVANVELRVVAPTGGSPAGVGLLDVLIGWWP